MTLENAITEAGAAGASDAQMGILTSAREAGEITFENAQQAAQSTVDCMIQAGLNAQPRVRVEPSGLSVPGYLFSATAGISDDQATALAEDCERLENYWVNMLFQMQPSSLEVRMAFIETRRPELLACLRENGVSVRDDDPIESLLDASRNLLRDSLDGATPGTIPVDCAGEAGVGTY